MLDRLIQSAIQIALSYVGEKEDPAGSNSSQKIDLVQSSFNYNKVQYCALFSQYIYKVSCKLFGIEFPFPGTASSQTLYEWAKKNNCASNNFSELQVGDIIIWRKRKLWQGHVGVVVDVDFMNEVFYTVEGNTSNSDFGSQRDGDGIYKRKRFMKKSDFVVDAFWLRGFIKIRQAIDINKTSIIEVDNKK